MKKPNINELINIAKKSSTKKVIQKVVPTSKIEKEEVQFSFYIDKALLKRVKLKALEMDVSIKKFINNAIKNNLNKP